MEKSGFYPQTNRPASTGLIADIISIKKSLIQQFQL